LDEEISLFRWSHIVGIVKLSRSIAIQPRNARKLTLQADVAEFPLLNVVPEYKSRFEPFFS
jgi:hypothetical protein